jgi:hypothetical protein
MGSARAAGEQEHAEGSDVARPVAEVEPAEAMPGELAGLPAVPGLVLRAVAGEADPLGGTAIPPAISAALQRRASAGRALPAQWADRIGQELGHDLSDVRLHTDSEASGIARSVQAVAFTHGRDIYFQQGTYAPDTAEGMHLLAHELSHVADESAAGGRSTGAVIGRADDPAERAADQSAARIVGALRRRHAGNRPSVEDGKPRAPIVDALRRRVQDPARSAASHSAEPKPAAAKSAGSKPGGSAAVIRRTVQIKFETQEHEMDDPVDPLTAKITYVLATRSPANVATEDKWPAAAQGAHTTSHAVLTYMWVRSLENKTWLQAWQLVRDRLVFLQKLLAAWYSDDALAGGRSRLLKTALEEQVTGQLAACDEQLKREGHSLAAGVWGAKPKVGPGAWKYYDHQPTLVPDGVDPSTHFIKPWKPLLDSSNVAKLQDACEAWMTIRGQIPWTSVDAESYVTGDRTGPEGVQTAATGLVAKDALSNSEADSIAKPILKTFDFFPAKLNSKRTSSHAAGVAARHLVEHFEYHPDIKAAWRAKVKERFLVLWKAKVTQERTVEDDQHERYLESLEEDVPRSKKEPKKKKAKQDHVPDGRETAALDELLSNWDAVVDEFNRLYLVLAAALT